MTPEGYHHLTKLLMNLANGKVVVALEVKQFTTLQYFFFTGFALISIIESRYIELKECKTVSQGTSRLLIELV